MRSLARFGSIIMILALLADSVAAQTQDDYHPFLSDRLHLDVGVFWPQVDFTMRIDGSHPDEEIDFSEALNLNDNQAAGSINFRWRFGKKWSFWAQYWSTDNSGGTILEENIEWEDIVFREGTFVEGGVSLDVVRAFFGREFSIGPRHEFGAGIGVHHLDLQIFLEGEVIIDDETTEFQRVNASATFPLPNIGAWYMYSWSPKWLFQTRVDWLSASIGDYSGGMWGGQAGFNYQAFRNIGFGLYYKAFLLDVDIDKSDWFGKADLNQNGPLLTLTASW